MVKKRYTRFKDISVSERILNTVFLLTIGLSYLEPNLKYKSDKDVILQWIQHGADEPEYNDNYDDPF